MVLKLGAFFAGWIVCLVGVPELMSGAEVKRPLIVAHRGGAGLAPENTLAAFRNALALNVDAVEFDLHLSRDGTLMVIHDPDVHATTDGHGAVGSLTLAELKTLNAAAKFKGAPVEPQTIPALQEVLALVQGRVQIQIEIKVDVHKSRYAGIEPKLLGTLRQHDILNQVTVISFDFPTLLDLNALAPELRLCALVSDAYLNRFDVRWRPDSVADDLATHGFTCVGIKHTRLTRRLMNAFRAQGLRVGVWTVNEPADMRKFNRMGVDFITTDRPDLLHDVLR